MTYQITTATKKLSQLKKRIRGVAGGTSASKTISILMLLIDYAQSHDNELISIVSESFPHLKRGVMRDFINIMTAHNYFKDANWNKTDYIYTFETGTKIEFFSADQPGKVRGPRRDVLFINEANNIPYETYVQLEVRTKKIIWLDWNPEAEFWFYTEIKDKEDCDFIILTYLDNEALSPEIVKSIEAKKNNKRWWTVYGEGQLGEVEGRIYTGWQIIDEIPHEARLERYGLDFGFSIDPTVIEALYYCDGGYIIDEKVYQKGLSNRSIADMFSNMDRALVIADSAEPKSIDEIKSYGVNIIGATKGQGSVMQGIRYVQDQRISITSRSLKTITAYRNYMLAKDNLGNFVDVPDDSVHEWSNPMDAIRYAFNGQINSNREFIDPNIYNNFSTRDVW